MKSSYHIQLSPSKIAIADLHPWGFHGHDPSGLKWRVARICVPVGFRGQGIGSQLMNQITHDADVEGVSIGLEPVPYDGPEKFDDLVRFYESHGFEMVRGIDYCYMNRPPGGAHVDTHETGTGHGGSDGLHPDPCGADVLRHR